MCVILSTETGKHDEDEECLFAGLFDLNIRTSTDYPMLVSIYL